MKPKFMPAWLLSFNLRQGFRNPLDSTSSRVGRPPRRHPDQVPPEAVRKAPATERLTPCRTPER